MFRHAMMTHAATFAVLLLSSLLVAKSDAATSCQAEFNQFKTCMGTAFNRVVQKADVDSKLAKVHVCFKNGNCKVSNQLTGGDSTKGATCNKSLFRQLGQSIDTCMKRKAPNFSYKEMMKKAPGSASYNFAEAKRKISKMVLLKQDVKSCPANTRQRVDNCRKPVAKQSTEDMKRYIDELCSAKNGCLAKISNSCKKQLEERKRDMLKCACETIERDPGKYAHEFLGCLGRKDSPTVEGTVKRSLPRVCQKLRQNADLCQSIKSIPLRWHVAIFGVTIRTGRSFAEETLMR
ncbi:hypothetical protein M514_22596 [Trichuris suis]|uniref:Cysteine rich repeat-containing domain protein n=1 Tax=Trichuris suis TaxID=68888 RepID=A0A085N6X0_9BILA|nr:hypothetical protein M514_22596 [Trichuris suis]